MARITVEDCLSNVANRFALVMLASKRAKQLMKGSELTVEHHDDNKIVVQALREIAVGNVLFDPDLSQGSVEEQISRDLNR